MTHMNKLLGAVMVVVVVGCGPMAEEAGALEGEQVTSEHIAAILAEVPEPTEEMLAQAAAACMPDSVCPAEFSACSNWSAVYDCGGLSACSPWAACRRCVDEGEDKPVCYNIGGQKQNQNSYRVCFNAAGQSCTEYSQTLSSATFCGCAGTDPL